MSYYQNIIEKATNNSSVATLYLPIARIQQKLSKPDKALITFKLIEENYSQKRMDGGLPLGVAAVIETGRLYLVMDLYQLCY